jgi:hypothetical protein
MTFDLNYQFGHNDNSHLLASQDLPITKDGIDHVIANLLH